MSIIDTAETVSQCAERIARTDVHSCLSSIIFPLANGYVASYRSTNRELVDLVEQAKALSAPVLDWQEAAIQAGWSVSKGEPEGTVHRDATAAERAANLGQAVVYAHSWEQACEIDGLKQHGWEVYEHWAVSNWLAEQLKAQGERVDEDFAGLNVWARTNFGQLISADPAFQRIARDLLAA